MVEKIPFAKIYVGDEEKKVILDVLESGMLASGEYIDRLEKEFARYVGAKYAVAVSNGTDGLFLAYLALGLTFKKCVVTTPITFIATASTIIHTGAVPIFADVDKHGNLDGYKVRDLLRDKRCHGVSIVHLYGRPVDFDIFKEVSEEFNVPIIEDASHAHGAEWKGKKVGSLGDIAVFSLYPTKMIAAGGWGGIITTSSEELYEKLIYLRAHGEERVKKGHLGAYTYRILGYNYRMSNLEAAFALKQLEKIDFFIEKRRRNARLLNEILEGIPGILTPEEPTYGKHVYYLYNLILEYPNLAKHRDKIVAKLNELGVPAQRGYHTPLHKQPLFKNINNPSVNHFAKINKYPNYHKEVLPRAEMLAASSIWLPTHPLLEENQVVDMGEKVKEVLKQVERG